MNWKEGKPHIDILGTTVQIPNHLLSKQKIEYLEFVKGCESHLSSFSVEKAGHIPQPSKRAGETSMSTGQLAGETSTGELAGDTSMNSHHHMEYSENIDSIQDDNQVLWPAVRRIGFLQLLCPLHRWRCCIDL